MKFAKSKVFSKNFKKLTKEEQELTIRKLQLFASYSIPPYHPSLRIKKVQGTSSIMELSVNMDIRITWQYEQNETILLRNIGHHQDALNRP